MGLFGGDSTKKNTVNANTTTTVGATTITTTGLNGAQAVELVGSASRNAYLSSTAGLSANIKLAGILARQNVETARALKSGGGGFTTVVQPFVIYTAAAIAAAIILKRRFGQ